MFNVVYLNLQYSLSRQKYQDDLYRHDPQVYIQWTLLVFHDATGKDLAENRCN